MVMMPCKVQDRWEGRGMKSSGVTLDTALCASLSLLAWRYKKKQRNYYLLLMIMNSDISLITQEFIYFGRVGSNVLTTHTADLATERSYASPVPSDWLNS